MFEGKSSFLYVRLRPGVCGGEGEMGVGDDSGMEYLLGLAECGVDVDVDYR